MLVKDAFKTKESVSLSDVQFSATTASVSAMNVSVSRILRIPEGSARES